MPWWKFPATWALAASIVTMVALVAIVVTRRPAAPVMGQTKSVAERPGALTARVELNLRTRDVGGVAELTMSAGTQWADIILQFVDTPPRPLSVQVLDAAGREVERAEFPDAAQGQVTVHLPASKLPPGDYHISAGPVTSGSGKRVSYAFRVTY
jgi:hypothetical protein